MKTNRYDIFEVMCIRLIHCNRYIITAVGINIYHAADVAFRFGTASCIRWAPKAMPARLVLSPFKCCSFV